MLIWAKLVAAALALAQKVAELVQRKGDRDAGAAEQREESQTETLRRLEAVSAPASGADTDRLWDENKAKFGPGGAKAKQPG